MSSRDTWLSISSIKASGYLPVSRRVFSAVDIQAAGLPEQLNESASDELESRLANSIWEQISGKGVNEVGVMK